jgi:hypothetical protein
MTDITYSRNFVHEDWRDGEDIVQAGGEKGFNEKFHALETEFDRLSAVIAQINASLVPVIPTRTLTFAPSFFPRGGNIPWTQLDGIASKGTNQTAAEGWLPLQLPDGTRIQTMTVIGEKSGNVGSFLVQLVRQSISGALTTLLTIQLADQPNSFQVSETVPTTNNLVDNKTFKYLVIGRIIGAEAAATARLFAIQFLCGPGQS